MILNRQRAVRVARRPLELFLARVRRELGIGEADVTICFISDAEIARMNQAFRKKKGPTDVLSFPAGSAAHSRRCSNAERRGADRKAKSFSETWPSRRPRRAVTPKNVVARCRVNYKS